MTDLDSLLKASAERSELPLHFLEGVMTRIESRQERLLKRKLLRNGLLLSGALILLFYALSILLIDLLAAETISFISFALQNPNMLAIQAGWFAVMESIPFVSLLLVATTTTISILLLRSFLRSSHCLPSFHCHYTH